MDAEFERQRQARIIKATKDFLSGKQTRVGRQKANKINFPKKQQLLFENRESE